MMLTSGPIGVQYRPFWRLNTLCLASPSETAQELRHQLDNLHKEDGNTRVKANNARLRLMRLSEAVEKLRMQAATSVRKGNENDARDYLFQKKKVMQAMEKLKHRIEMFDKLSAKLNEAISMKESMLVGHMASDIDVVETEAPSPVRIVSPTEENPKASDLNQHWQPNNLEFGEDQKLLSSADSEGGNDCVNVLNNHEEPSIQKNCISAEDSTKISSTYTDFMEHLDQRLNEIEEELETFLKFPNLLLEGNGMLDSSKLQHATEILESIHHTRQRIASAKQTKEQPS